MSETKVYEWTCPKCGKEIKSLSDKQFEYLKKQHIIFKHDGKVEE